MARRVVLRDRVGQPQLITGVNWGNPITRGLDLVVGANGSRALFQLPGPVLVSSGGAAGVQTSSPFGSAVSITSTAVFDAASGLPVIPDNAGGYTVLGVVVLASVSGTQTIAHADNSPRCFQFRLNSGSLEMIAFNTSNAAFTASVSGAGVAGALTVVVGRVQGTGVTAFSRTSRGTATITATPRGVRGTYSIGNRLGSAPLNGQFLLHARWNRPLSDAEVASVQANPWQLFEPQTRSMSWATGTAYMQSVLGSLTLSGLISRRTNKLAVGSTTTSGAITRHTSTREQGSITTSAGPVVGGNFAQSASGSITLSSVLTDAVTFVRSYGSVINLSGALAKPVSKILRGTIALVGSVFKLVTKATFTASMTIAGALSAFSFTPGGGGGVLGRGLRFMRKFIGRR